MSPTGYFLCDDLLFGSRVTATARAANLDLRTVRTPAALVDAVKAQPPICALLDLHLAGTELPTLLKTLKAASHCTVVGFGSHVAADLLRQARDAGCDVVMPRSQFVEGLGEALPRWFGVK
jgi:DNA-binding NarL/FixJ family response regulator